MSVFTLVNPASLPESYVPNYEGCESEKSVDPMLGTQYNLWQLTPVIGDGNNDGKYDNLYYGSYRYGDTIYYRESKPTWFYTLSEIPVINWYNEDGVNPKSSDDLFEKQTPVGGLGVLVILAIAYFVIKKIDEKRKEKNKK